ncbi:MAG: SprB repeat-containing protein, partial [Bacteroidetes bacterium]|nr:SprB repeat-containing protein [Bacteroidota bacterium]
MAAVSITCNSLCNGSAMVISVSGGCGGPYTFDWQGGLTPSGEGTDSIFNLCAGNYTVRVTDGCGSFCFCNINVSEPSVLFDYELFNTPASCNGVCDGAAAVDATGGTFPYSYLWTPGGYTNDTV